MDNGEKYTESGREGALGLLTATLISRLYSQKGWREHGQVLQAKFRRPLVITGIPRSCTTALHKVLSLDPQFQGLENWLINTPMIRPPRAQWEGVPEHQRAIAGYREVDTAATRLVSHEVAPDDPDECLALLRQSFVSNNFPSSLHVPDYDKWWRRQDETASYRRYFNNLKLIGYADQDKTWLLKNPGHVYGMKQFLELFPDACMVQTHRHPVEAVPSVASTIYVLGRVPFHGPDADARAVGLRENENWANHLRVGIAVRREHEELFHDVYYDDYRADPMKLVRGIYHRFGFTLDPLVEQTMIAWVAANPQGKGGVHRYTLEQFGLTEAMVRDQFQDYIERFNLG